MRDLEDGYRSLLPPPKPVIWCFSTLHTSSAAKTIDRLIDIFPAGEKEQVAHHD